MQLELVFTCEVDVTSIKSEIERIKKPEMARKLQAIIIASLLAFTSAKVVPVISEQYETCVSPENSAGKYDTSGVELIALTDTDLFVNGSLKILKEVKSPFSGKVFAERFDRGAWSLELFNRNYNDFCTTFINPLEPSYVFTSKMEPKACPFPANVRLYLTYLTENFLFSF